MVQDLLCGIFMIDSYIMAGNNEQKDGDSGDAECLGSFIVCRVATLCLSGKEGKVGCCMLAGIILVRRSLEWRKNSPYRRMSHL